MKKYIFLFVASIICSPQIYAQTSYACHDLLGGWIVDFLKLESTSKPNIDASKLLKSAQILLQHPDASLRSEYEASFREFINSANTMSNETFTQNLLFFTSYFPSNSEFKSYNNRFLFFDLRGDNLILLQNRALKQMSFADFFKIFYREQSNTQASTSIGLRLLDLMPNEALSQSRIYAILNLLFNSQPNSSISYLEYESSAHSKLYKLIDEAPEVVRVQLLQNLTRTSFIREERFHDIIASGSLIRLKEKTLSAENFLSAVRILSLEKYLNKNPQISYRMLLRLAVEVNELTNTHGNAEAEELEYFLNFLLTKPNPQGIRRIRFGQNSEQLTNLILAKLWKCPPYHNHPYDSRTPVIQKWLNELPINHDQKQSLLNMIQNPPESNPFGEGYLQNYVL